MLIRFPVERVRHGRASAAARPKTAGSGRWPRPASSAVKTRNCSEGIRPRAFQFETADDPTCAKSAALEVPPSASMMASTVVSMGHEYSHFVNKSSLHTMAIVTGCELLTIGGMTRALKDVCRRLEMTRGALELTAAELCRQSGIKPNQWSQFVNPAKKRRITVAAVYKLKDAFGVTLEWVYDGDPSMLPHKLAQKLRKPTAA